MLGNPPPPHTHPLRPRASGPRAEGGKRGDAQHLGDFALIPSLDGRANPRFQGAAQTFRVRAVAGRPFFLLRQGEHALGDPPKTMLLRHWSPIDTLLQASTSKLSIECTSPVPTAQTSGHSHGFGGPLSNREGPCPGFPRNLPQTWIFPYWTPNDC